MAATVFEHRRGSTSLRQGARGSLSEKRPSLAGLSGLKQSTPAEKDLAAHVKDIEALFTVSPQRLRMITDDIVEAMKLGLSKEGQTLSMYPVWIFGWPSGKETGSYLAVDLGGTNMRTCRVDLSSPKEGQFKITQTKYRISEEHKLADGQELFDYCAECLGSFVIDQYGDGSGSAEMPVLDKPIPLGFTFSYPCRQDRVDHGVLKTWTKGFNAPGVEGHDVAELFRKSLAKFNVPVSVSALVNDACGTLVASAYVDSSTKIGVIFGTGCNATYAERIGNIPKLAHLGLPADEEIVINIEWGAFDNEHQSLPRTRFDEIIDKHSPRPGEQIFEKMIAGYYLGELFRLAVVSIISKGALFASQDTFSFEKPYCFDTAYLSLIEGDSTEPLLTIAGLFAHFYKLETTLEERKCLKRIAELVGTRSARLSACGIAAIVTIKGYQHNGCGVATDGSLYAHYPGFPERLHEALLDILGEDGRKILTYAAEDGSGVGSAIIAAMTAQRRELGVYPDF